MSVLLRPDYFLTGTVTQPRDWFECTRGFTNSIRAGFERKPVMTFLVKLSRGYTAEVDEADADRVLQYSWYVQINRHPDGSIKALYGKRSLILPDGKKSTQLLHRFIAGVSDPEIEVDHRDHNGLRNVRANLRICSRTQNHANRRTVGQKFKGVRESQTTGKWVAGIKMNSKRQHLG